MTETPEAPLLTEIRGHLGLITLNRPKAVNALTIEMIDLFQEALDAFEQDQNVMVVAVVGAGERGLCAGGDVRALHEAATGDQPEQGIEFFRKEYTLNHRISVFPKPYVPIMSGLVLGGGIGISVAGSHRVVTDSTRAGMPETGIGFAPDVGGLNYLAKSPGRVGAHLALTGAHIDGADALFARLADYYVQDARVEDLLEALSRVGNPGEVAQVITDHGRPEEGTEFDPGVQDGPPESALAAAQEWIDEAYAAESVEGVRDNLRALVEKDPENDAAARALEAVERNSPTGMKTAWVSLQRAADQTLAETLQDDFRRCGNAISAHDMGEGIRAQIIDKDRNPQWDPATLEEVGQELVERFLGPVPGHEDLDLPGA